METDHEAWEPQIVVSGGPTANVGEHLLSFPNSHVLLKKPRGNGTQQVDGGVPV